MTRDVESNLEGCRLAVKLVAALLCAVVPLGLFAGCTPRRPNVILVLADDLGYGSLGSYGQEWIHTPELDALAGEGLRFTNFHAGAPVCLPSRCALMTGMHTGHCRVHDNWRGPHKIPSHKPLLEDDVTVADVLKAAGYRTGAIGKWALGDQFLGNTVEVDNTDGSGAVYKHGWDYYFGEPYQTYAHEYYPDHLYEYDRNGEVMGKPTGDRLVPVPMDGRYSHDALTEHALRFIDAHHATPFFLYVAYTIPHFDYVVPELEPYTADQPWRWSEKVYASMITRLDRDVGRIMSSLRRHGIDDDTLVIFTSDNGGDKKWIDTFQVNGDLPGAKASVSDGGVMVPFIAHWPGTISPGRESDEMLAFWDVLPTLAEMACVSPPGPLDGISFLPILRGETQREHHAYLYWHLNGVDRVKRTTRETRSVKEIKAENWGVVTPDGDLVRTCELR